MQASYAQQLCSRRFVSLSAQINKYAACTDLESLGFRLFELELLAKTCIYAGVAKLKRRLCLLVAHDQKMGLFLPGSIADPELKYVVKCITFLRFNTSAIDPSRSNHIYFDCMGRIYVSTLCAIELEFKPFQKYAN